MRGMNDSKFNSHIRNLDIETFYVDEGSHRRKWNDPPDTLIKEMNNSYSEKLFGRKEFFDYMINCNFNEELYEEQLLESKSKEDENIYRGIEDIAKDVKIILPLKLKQISKEDYEDLDGRLHGIINSLDFEGRDKENYILSLEERFALKDGYKNGKEVANILGCSKQWVQKMHSTVSDILNDKSYKRIKELKEDFIDRIVSMDYDKNNKLKKNIVKRYFKHEESWQRSEMDFINFTFNLIDLNAWDFLYGYLKGEREFEEVENSKLYREWHEKEKTAKEIAAEFDTGEEQIYRTLNNFYKLGFFEHRQDKEETVAIEQGIIASDEEEDDSNKFEERIDRTVV